MQTNSFYLYSNLINVYLNLSPEWQTERYRNVYNRTLKIYRGVDNRIDIQVRNSDQKAIDITGYTPVISIVNREESLILKKDATVVSLTTGRVYVDLLETELWNIEPGFYKYSVHLESRTADGDNYVVNERKPAFTDSQYGVFATLEVYGSIKGEPLPVKEYRNFLRTSPASVGETGDDFYTSTLIEAGYETTRSQGLHTFAIYLNNYTGNLKLEASLDDSADPTNWSELNSFDFSDQNLLYHNVEGKWKWFRFVHTPSAGTVDKIIYR